MIIFTHYCSHDNDDRQKREKYYHRLVSHRATQTTRFVFLWDSLNCWSTESTVRTGQLRYTCTMQIASRRSSLMAASPDPSPWACVQSCQC